MATNQKNRRKHIYLKTDLQKRVIKDFVFLPMACLMVCLVLITLFCTRLAYEAASVDLELVNILPLFLSIMGFIAVAAPLMVYQAIRHSHRVAGPVYRMTEDLKAIREGDHDKRIHLRKDDYLNELADAINELLDSKWKQNEPASADDSEPATVAHDAR